MRTIITLLVLGFGMMASAENTNDTIIVEKPQKVRIITTDSLQSVEVIGSKQDSAYHYQNTMQLVDSNYVSTTDISPVDFNLNIGKFSTKDQKKDFEVTFGANFYFGWNGAVGAPDELDFRPFNSWEIWWNMLSCDIRPWHRSRDGITIGLGIDWRNYRMKGTRFFSKAEDGVLSAELLPEGAHLKFSRIKVISLAIPITYTVNMGHGYGFSFGPVVDFNSTSSALTRYTQADGSKQKVKFKDVHATPVTVDLLAQINTPVLNYYFKYSPCNVLDTKYGPKFQSLSFGFCF